MVGSDYMRLLLTTNKEFGKSRSRTVMNGCEGENQGKGRGVKNHTRTFSLPVDMRSLMIFSISGLSLTMSSHCSSQPFIVLVVTSSLNLLGVRAARLVRAGAHVADNRLALGLERLDLGLGALNRSTCQEQSMYEKIANKINEKPHYDVSRPRFFCASLAILFLCKAA